MSWLQVKIPSTPEFVDVITEGLTLAGALAITYEDLGDQPIYEPDMDTIPLWENTGIIGLFESENNPIPFMETYFKNLSLPLPFTYKVELLADKDWERVWMDNYLPMQFGKNLWICPSWCEIPDNSAINILLDPGLAFGTGTHATTALCLEWLDENPPIHEKVIDYGCGSGILGIAAAKLGASKIICIDHDPLALESTRNNAMRNNINANQLQTVLPAALLETEIADTFIANILAKPLIDLGPKFAQLTHPGSKIALSGILINQKEDILSHYSPWFELTSEKVLDGWIRLSGFRK
ncbi:MAG: Ribosomal protein L11 methyltransferase [Legionellaceae bacterium]